MLDDPIVKEVREAGAKMAEACNFDVHAFFEMIREHERESISKGWKMAAIENIKAS
jgi:hypothetical protein